MMERPPIFTTCSQGRSRIGRLPATGRVSSPSSRVWRASGEATCLMVSVVLAMAVVLSARGDDGADVLAGERAGQIAGDEAIHNLHLADVACRLEQVEHREFEDRVRAAPWPSFRRPRSSGSGWRPSRSSGSRCRGRLRPSRRSSPCNRTVRRRGSIRRRCGREG